MATTTISIGWQYLSIWLGPAVTFFVGCFAIGLYIQQRRDYKRDIALLIRQEIRYAEQQIGNSRSFSPKGDNYPLAIKILPTNSWYKNIHLFANDFEESQRDAISKFYAQVEYMDYIIQGISEYKMSIFNEEIKDQHGNIIQKESVLPERVYLSKINKLLTAQKFSSERKNQVINNDVQSTSAPTGLENPPSNVKILSLEGHLYANEILKEVSNKVEFILNTPIGEKFKIISEQKIFGFF